MSTIDVYEKSSDERRLEFDVVFVCFWRKMSVGEVEEFCRRSVATPTRNCARFAKVNNRKMQPISRRRDTCTVCV